MTVSVFPIYGQALGISVSDCPFPKYGIALPFTANPHTFGPVQVITVVIGIAASRLHSVPNTVKTTPLAFRALSVRREAQPFLCLSVQNYLLLNFTCFVVSRTRSVIPTTHWLFAFGHR